MGSPDHVLKLQRQLGAWGGTRQVAGWLALGAGALCVVSVLLVLLGVEKQLTGTFSPLSTIVVCLLLRAEAERKIRVIEAELSA